MLRETEREIEQHQKRKIEQDLELFKRERERERERTNVDEEVVLFRMRRLFNGMTTEGERRLKRLSNRQNVCFESNVIKECLY